MVNQQITQGHYEQVQAGAGAKRTYCHSPRANLFPLVRGKRPITKFQFSPFCAPAETIQLAFPAALDVDLEAFDLLIEGGKRDLEAFGGISLAPVGTSQHIENDLTLLSFHDFEKRLPGEFLGGFALAAV